MNDVLATFDAAWNLIKPKEQWIQDEMATDKDGLNVSAQNPNAVCWCSMGATLKVLGPDPSTERRHNVARVQSALRKAMSGNITNFNDTHTHEEVMQRWYAARRELEKNA